MPITPDEIQRLSKGYKQTPHGARDVKVPPLMIAVNMEDYLLVKSVLSETDPNIFNGVNEPCADAGGENGERLRAETAMHYVARTGNTAIARLLLKHGGDLFPARTSTPAPIHIAVRNEKEDFLDLLLEEMKKAEKTDLIDEGEGWSFSDFKAAEEKDESVDCETYERNAGSSALQLAAEKNNTRMVKALLDAGACANINWSGWNALCWAVRHNNLEMAKVLLEHGADPSQKCEQQSYRSMDWEDTAFFVAVEEGTSEMLECLAAAATEKQIREGNGEQSPLYCAIAPGRLEKVKILIKYGARLDYKGYDSMKHHSLRFRISRKGGQSEPSNREQWTPLIKAADVGEKEILKCIIEAIKEELKASQKELEEIKAKLQDPALLDVEEEVALLEKQKWLSAFLRRDFLGYLNAKEPEHGYTALHQAVVRGNREAVKVLHEAGADPTITSRSDRMNGSRFPMEGDTPLSLAVKMYLGIAAFPTLTKHDKTEYTEPYNEKSLEGIIQILSGDAAVMDIPDAQGRSVLEILDQHEGTIPRAAKLKKKILKKLKKG